MAGNFCCTLPRLTGPSDWMASTIRGLPARTTLPIIDS
jgi:hypothetical protein